MCISLALVNQIVNFFEHISQLLLCLLKLAPASLLEVSPRVEISLAPCLSKLEVFARELLVSKFEEVGGVGVSRRALGRSCRLGLLLRDQLKELVLQELALGLLIPQGLLSLEKLAVEHLVKRLLLGTLVSEQSTVMVLGGGVS